MDSRRFNSLDGLRALSIVPVVWHHATPRPLEGVLGRGPLGVDLFFAISGFLITTLLLRERDDTGTVSLPRFYARRSVRIFPLYYLVLGAFVLHALFAREHGPVRDHFLASLPAHATYTSNWFVDWSVPHGIVFAFGWSLAAEEQFYLMWPWIVRASRGLVLPALAMGLLFWLDQAAERGMLDGVLASGLALRMLRSIATPICLGALCAIGVRAGVLEASLRHRASAPVSLLVLVLSAVYAWPLLLAQTAMAALVGAVCVRPDHLLAPVLENKAVRHVGTVSYGIYLLNVPVVAAAKRVLGDERTIAVFLVGLAGSVAVATVAYYAVERPLLALRERLRPRPPLDARPARPLRSGFGLEGDVAENARVSVSQGAPEGVAQPYLGAD
ncbi:MAG TPA: acyltransferase [Polyangiaceae bacterium]|nr:acyltransferase [Polyangiaceae bacterium]